jgi:hypothetical protein
MKPPGYYTTKIMVGDNRLDIVPPEKRTENLCSIAVNRNSWDLEHVPDDCKTYEICLNAVQNTGRMLKYVLDKHKDYNMCHKAIVLSNKKDSSTIKYVDKSMISEYDYNFLVIEAVSNDGDALEHVPKEKKTLVLCDIAVKSRKRAIRYVPLEVSNYNDLCKIAFTNNGLALKHVPIYIKSPGFKELYKIALTNNGLALEYVPFLQRTFELCEIAYNNNNNAIDFAPDHIKEQLYDQTQAILKEKNNRRLIYTR